jgi:hypothetical protein
MFAVVLVLALPAAVAFAHDNTHPNNGKRAHGNPDASADNSHKIKDTSAGSWGPNGHQPADVSSPQGYSPSDPDGTSNGGADKPGGSGGFNSDKDGNNGCGNDTDREDDNNGWCGKKPTNGSGGEVTPTPTPTPSSTAAVLGVTLTRNQGSTSVLGVTLSRTGTQISLMVLLGITAVMIGSVLRRRGSRARARR